MFELLRKEAPSESLMIVFASAPASAGWQIWCRSSAVVSVRVLRPYHSRNAPPNADEGGQESLTDVPGRRRICARSGVRVFHASLRAGEEKKLKLLPPLDFSFASPDAGK